MYHYVLLLICTYLLLQNKQGVCNLMKKCTEELDCQTSSNLSDGCFCKRRGQCKCSPKNGRCMPDMSKQLSKSSSVKRGKLLKSQITKQWAGSRIVTRYLFIVASKWNPCCEKLFLIYLLFWYIWRNFGIFLFIYNFIKS